MVDDSGYIGSTAPSNIEIIRNVQNQIQVDAGKIDIELASKIAGNNSGKKMSPKEAKALVKAYMEANDVSLRKAAQDFQKEFGYPMPKSMMTKIANVMISSMVVLSPIPGDAGKAIDGISQIKRIVTDQIIEKMTAKGENWSDDNDSEIIIGENDFEPQQPSLAYEPVPSEIGEVEVMAEKKKAFVKKFAEKFLDGLYRLNNPIF